MKQEKTKKKNKTKQNKQFREQREIEKKQFVSIHSSINDCRVQAMSTNSWGLLVDGDRESLCYVH